MSENPRKLLASPAPGVTLIGVALVDEKFRDYSIAKMLNGDAEPEPAPGVVPEAVVACNVRLSDDGSQSVARLRVNVTYGEPKVWDAAVTLAAMFSAEPEIRPQLNDFSWQSGLSLLVPYARERLSGLTSASRYGTYVLPPLILRGMSEEDYLRATEGDTSVGKPEDKTPAKQG